MSDTSVKMRLPVRLTPGEIAEAAMTVATRQEEYDKAEQDKKGAVNAWTDKLKSLRSEMSIESRKATTGIDQRIVECRWRIDRRQGMAELYRGDTGEMVSRRRLTSTELQLTMDAIVRALTNRAEEEGDAFGADEEIDEEAEVVAEDVQAEASQEDAPEYRPQQDESSAEDDEEEFPKYRNCKSCMGMLTLKKNIARIPLRYECGCGNIEALGPVSAEDVTNL